MKRLTRDQLVAPGDPADPTHFTGPVRNRTLHAADGVRALVVNFEDGARTPRHSHAGGQVLHVIEGRGRTRSRSGDEVEIGPGDVIVADPGEEHWHGAAEGTAMTHLAISIGDTSWSAPPD